jgi:hypothetical protein
MAVRGHLCCKNHENSSCGTASGPEDAQSGAGTCGGLTAASPTVCSASGRRPVVVAGCWDVTCDHLVGGRRNRSPAKTNLERGTVHPIKMQ